MKKIITLSLVFLSLSSTASTALARNGQMQAITVVTEQVQTHEVSQSLTLVGKIDAKQSVVISPEVTGESIRLL